MMDIKHMDKKAVYDVMLDLIYSMDVGWIKMATHLRDIYSSLNRNPELNLLLEQTNADIGRYEAKRLRETLNIKKTDINSLIEMLKHSHWFVLENIEVEKLTDKCFRMRTIDCTAQRATKKRWNKYFDCANNSLKLRKAFFVEINKSAEVHNIFTPTESGAEIKNGNVSCEWEISID